VPEELLSRDAVTGIRVTLRDGNWRLAAENGLDPSHAAYLHRNAWVTLFQKFPAAKTNVAPQNRRSVGWLFAKRASWKVTILVWGSGHR
jgi:phenylpropionate dioxygenase-like ring-hydroxylating dioxygenase large terminal subunit